MPPSDRSQSLDLHAQSQQGSQTGLQSRSSSMFSSRAQPYNAPIIRFTSRRPRPTAVSITDLFINSLVTASLCGNHSPRHRKSYTTSRSTANVGSSTWRGKGMASRRRPPEKRPCHLGRSYEAPGGLRGLKSRAMLGSEAPMPLEESRHNDDHVEKQPVRPISGWRNKSSRLSQPRPKRPPKHVMTSSNSLDSAKRDDTFSETLSQSTSLIHRPHFSMESYIFHHPEPRDEGLTPDLETTTNGTGVGVPESCNRHSRREMLWYKRNSQDGAGNSMPPLVKRLVDAVANPSKSNQHIFRLYKDLPFPGVLQLPETHRFELLRRFADPVNKRRIDARRYLVLVEDMNVADLRMSRSLWTSAVYLVGRTTDRPTKQDLVKAVSIWQSMEQQGLESDVVMFTALFDIAIKSCQFIVADRLLSEMEARGIKFDRFGEVSKIYYFSLLGDVQGIRSTFAEFYQSGHIVDTVVLNCLLASYTRLNDMRTANQLYERMMEAQRSLQRGHHLVGAKSPHLQPALTHEMPSYRKRNRETGRFLNSMDASRHQSPQQHVAVQQAMPMTPDTRTFHILLAHHARRTGNLRRFMAILEDMESVFRIPPRGMVYLLLFEGFACHGGKKKHWNAERLRHAWKTYLSALYESMRRYAERENRRPQKVVWENPFTDNGPVSIKVRQPKPSASMREASGMFLPLPSSNPGAERSANDGERGDENDRHDDSADVGDIDVDELFNRTKQEDADAELAEMDRHIANGVFIGRQVIVFILRAFGACCGPNEVLEVWLKLDRIWYPPRRKALDVQVVKEELHKQLEKSKANIER